MTLSELIERLIDLKAAKPDPTGSMFLISAQVISKWEIDRRTSEIKNRIDLLIEGLP